MLWVRPDLAVGAPAALDSVFCEVDGVLIDTTRSYRLAVIHATDRLVRTVQGLPDAPQPLLTPADVAAFKLAGGFNNDWHATRMLTALWTARLREWQRQPQGAGPPARVAAAAPAGGQAEHRGSRGVGCALPAAPPPQAAGGPLGAGA